MAHPRPRPKRLVARAVATVIVALGIAWLSAAAAEAATGPNGRIAFSVCAGDICDIWAMDPDGTNQVNLTDTADISERQPVWSPDGTRIAFVRDLGAFNIDIWVMNADGTGQVNITNQPLFQFGPTWSPDGTRIAFVREVPGQVISTQFDVFVMNIDGTSLANITNSDTDEIEPAWSPDGTRIAFAAVRVIDVGGDWEIVAVNPDGSGEVNLTASTLGTQEDRAPSWSPDGSKIVFMSQFDEICCGDWEIWAMNADGTGLTNLTNDPAGDLFPSWSPDGTQITFASSRESLFGELDIFSMPAPTTLPLPFTQQSLGMAALAAEGATVTRLTRNGQSTDPDWGREPGGPGGSFTLFVGLAGHGQGKVNSDTAGITCGRDCSESYPAGAAVTLKATPKKGSAFAGWTGACTGADQICRLVMDDDEHVKATFVRVR